MGARDETKRKDTRVSLTSQITRTHTQTDRQRDGVSSFKCNTGEVLSVYKGKSLKIEENDRVTISFITHARAVSIEKDEHDEDESECVAYELMSTSHSLSLCLSVTRMKVRASRVRMTDEWKKCNLLEHQVKWCSSLVTVRKHHPVSV